MSGYELCRVLAFCDEHGVVRGDGRVLRLNGRKLLETYRNSLATWRARRVVVVPLGRWDELLLSVDMMLWQYEAWELEKYGDLSYNEDVPAETGVYQTI